LKWNKIHGNLHCWEKQLQGKPTGSQTGEVGTETPTPDNTANKRERGNQNLRTGNWKCLLGLPEESTINRSDQDARNYAIANICSASLNTGFTLCTLDLYH
jgi:hypothetical protein